MTETKARVERVELDRELSLVEVAARLFGPSARSVALGRFELLRRLGSGSTGVVYEARDGANDQRVAIKVLPERDGRAVARFKREFRALAGVVHPHLAGLYELFCDAGYWFFSMELVDGVSFTRFVRPEGELDLLRLRASLAQLAEGVEGIHAAGKLHCDLKPRNVLVTRSGRVVILDFGLASELAPEDESDASHAGLVGTPAYLAPEQAAGSAASRASDWYAVGVMLFEALTGRLPFAGDPFELLREKQANDAPTASELARGLPDDLSALCAGLLRRSPGERLDGAAVRALQSMASAPVSVLVPAQLRRVFVGRQHELSQLETALARARAGQATSVMIGGCSGIGKSALLSRFAEQIGASALLLRGRCHEREAVPYKVFDAVVDAIARELSKRPDTEVRNHLPRDVDALLRLFPALGQVATIRDCARATSNDDARGLRKQAFAALKELLLRLTERVPVVLMVDDLHWGDADSGHMLAHVLGPPDPPPVLFVGAYRSEEERRSAFLLHVFDAAPEAVAITPERLTLGPLEPEAAAALASGLLGDGHEAYAAAIATEAQGVPFFITELAQHLSRRDLASGAQELASLDQLILERVERLPEPAQRLLQVLAIAAGPIELALLADAANVATDVATLNVLRAARFVRTRGADPRDTAEPYHDRIREVVIGALGGASARQIHAAIAAAIERHGVQDPERLLQHLEGAGQRERAAEVAPQAARAAAAQFAFNRAADLFRRAIALLPSATAVDPELRRELGDALANAGRGAEAAEAYLLAAAGLEGGAARRFTRMAARQLLRSGQLGRGTAIATQLLRQQKIRIEGGDLALIARIVSSRFKTRLTRSPAETGLRARQLAGERLETLAALQELVVGDPLRGFLLHSEFMRQALAGGTDVQRLQAFAREAYHCAVVGGARRERAAERALARAAALRDAIGTPYATAMVHMAEASVHLCSGRFALGIEPALQAKLLFDQCPEGCHFERSWTAALRFACLEFTGDLNDLLRETAELAREADERDDLSAIGLLALAYPLAQLTADEPDAALDFLRRVQDRLGDGKFATFRYFVVHRTVDTLLYQRCGVAALELLQERWRDIGSWYASRGMFMKSSIHYLRGRAALAAFRETRDPRYAALIRADIAQTQRLQHGFGGGAHVLRGGVHQVSGRFDLAEREFGQAAACFDREGADRLGLLAKLLWSRTKGGEEGERVHAATDAALRRLGIKRPESLMASHITWL